MSRTTPALPDDPAGNGHHDRNRVAVLESDDVLVRGVVEASPDAMVLCDDDGRILLANTQVEVLFGHARASLIGRPIEVLLPERFRHAHLGHRADYQARPSTRAMGDGTDLFGLRRDGREFPVEIALSPLARAGDRYTIATVRDVSTRRAREAAERAVRHSLDLAHDGVVLVGFDTGVVAYVNEGFRELTGYGLSDLSGVHLHEVCPRLDAGVARTLIAPVLAGLEASAVITTVLRRKDRRDVMIEALVQCPIDEHGTRHHYIAVLRDIDERVRQDNELHQARQVLALAEDRERIARDLHDNVIQRLFAGGLTLAALAAQLPVDIAGHVGLVIDQLDDTIRDLRNAVFGLGTTRDRDGDLRTEIEHVCDDAARMLGAHPSLGLHGPLDTTPSPVRPHLVAALRESLSNIAHHAGATNVSVDITVADHLQLVVRDDGRGFPPGGVALAGNGLRNLADRARALGGTFDIGSTPGEGTRLSWVVPI